MIRKLKIDHQQSYLDNLKAELSSYKERVIYKDGSFTEELINDSYLLENDTWNINWFKEIENFKESYEQAVGTTNYRNIVFKFNRAELNIELKYIFKKKLFNDEWSLATTISKNGVKQSRLADFINNEYQNISSLLHLDKNETHLEWINYLNDVGIKTKKSLYQKDTGRSYETNTEIANFFKMMHEALFTYTDSRIEWDKCRWDIRNLNKTYGIPYAESKANYFIDFSSIKNQKVKKSLQEYIRLRLLSRNNFSWSAALFYMRFVPAFINFILELEPNWDNFKNLNRAHFLKYVEFLNEYSSKIKHKRANPEKYMREAINTVDKFLSDSQMYNYDIAPEQSVKTIIFPEDRPAVKKKSYDQIDYIPDFVLEQLFENINDIHPEVQPIVWIAFKTGLRISDTLGLNVGCLVKLNGKFQIVTDIEKTYVQGHSIPIDEELANIIAVLIDKSQKNSNQDNNPKGYIFVRYRGSRKGKPYYQSWVAEQLNVLAREKNIVDENGKLFQFTNHQFRHTYAVKMINSGADILTVQELMAHASSEMTMRYARLLEQTKRKAFDNAINQGVFSFDLNGKIFEITDEEEVPKDIIEMLWRDQKLSSIDNPYGSCRARINGNCHYAEEPPCLTCNSGKPCKDLAVGLSDMDVAKYEIHIQSTSKMVEVAKQYGREEIAEKNQKNLERLQNIYNTIKQGNIIFGRMDRIRRKQGV